MTGEPIGYFGDHPSNRSTPIPWTPRARRIGRTLRGLALLAVGVLFWVLMLAASGIGGGGEGTPLDAPAGCAPSTLCHVEFDQH